MKAIDKKERKKISIRAKIFLALLSIIVIALALLWLCHHKNGKVGDVYATTEDCELEEYNYWITDNYDARQDGNGFCPNAKHVITIKCINWTEELVFDGTPEEWLAWLAKPKEQEE